MSHHNHNTTQHPDSPRNRSYRTSQAKGRHTAHDSYTAAAQYASKRKHTKPQPHGDTPPSKNDSLKHKVGFMPHTKTDSSSTPSPEPSSLSKMAPARWAEDFIRSLFDFSFSEVVTIKMLPLLYGLGIFSLFVTLGYITVETILISPLRGIILLVLIDPLLFIAGTAGIRILLEFCSSLFRMQSLMMHMNDGLKRLEVKMDKLARNVGGMDNHLGSMVGNISEMRDNFQSVTQVVEDLNGMTDKIPFIKKPKRDERKNWAESSISERFQYSTRSFYKIED